MIVTLPPTAGGSASYVLHERAQRFHGAGAGALSIKSFYGGRALYTVGRARFALDGSAYLVLNQGQEYAVTIESDAPVESFCVFFADGLAEQVARDLSTPDDRLLAEPRGPTGGSPQFYERSYPHDAIVSPALLELRRAIAAGRDEPGWLAERLHDLLGRLLQAHRHVSREVAAMPAARPATRAELYRRLHIAREYIAACYDRPVALDDVAAAACMSPNHLIRGFREAFGQTPHQYVAERRLERARHLLAHTRLSVTEICLAVGFESLGSFSWLFRRRVGVSPAEYRRQTR